jgi:hypothetical protein
VDVLEALRGDPATRPVPDPAVVEAARAHLEAAAAAWVESVPDGVVVRITKDAVTGVRRCELRHVGELAMRADAATPPPSPALVRGRLLDAVFRQVATTGAVGADPVAAAVAAAAAEGDAASTTRLGLDELDPDDQRSVCDDVQTAARRLVADWPPLPPGSGLRIQERVLVRLAGGRVELSGRPDVTVGRPTRHRAGVLVVEAKSGGFRPAHLEELRFYVLLEALRWRVAPFRAVLWCLGDGRLEAVEVDADLVWSEALRVADAITRLTRLAAGEPPRPSANPLCPSCPLLAGCPDGARQVALAGGWSPGFDDGDEEADGDDEGAAA